MAIRKFNPRKPGRRRLVVIKPEPESERRRPSARKRGYTTAWDKLRKRVFEEEPLCRWCLARDVLSETQIIDHIVPLAIAPERRLDRKNLQGLCRSCHKIKTDQEKAAQG